MILICMNHNLMSRLLQVFSKSTSMWWKLAVVYLSVLEWWHADKILQVIIDLFLLFFSCDRAALRMALSVRHTFFTMFPSSYHHEIFRSYCHGQTWYPCKRSRSEVKFQGLTGQNNYDFDPNWAFPDSNSSNIGEVPYCFSRSSVKFQGHTGQKIDDFDVRLLGRSQLSNPSDLPFFIYSV